MKRFWAGVLLGAVSLGCGVGLTATAAWLIARASQQPPVLYLMVGVVAVRAFGVSRPVLRYAERLITHDAAFRVLADARASIYNTLIPLAPAKLAEHRRGDLFSQLVADVDAVQDRLLRVRAPIVTAAIVGAVSGAVALWLYIPAGLVLVLLLLVASIAAPLAGAYAARHASAELADARARLSDTVIDLIRGAPELLIYGTMPNQLAQVERADAALTGLEKRTAWASGLGAGISTLVAGMAVVGVSAVSAPAVPGSVSPVTFAVLVFLPLAAFEAAAMLPRAGLITQRVRSSLGRLARTVGLSPAVAEPAAPASLPNGPYHLHLSRLSASWGPAQQPVLRGITLQLPPGRKVAIIGESGAGKSTLAAVLMRFIDYTGDYRINETSANQLANDDIRSLIGLVATDAHIFSSTLRENVKLARPDATDADITQALQRARFDRPLETWLGEGGSLISGGERQRVALARVLLADYPILVLDEPTAHLDGATATELIDDLLSAAEGRTVVLITHRPEGLDRVDEIFRLEDGRLVRQPENAPRAGALM